MVLVLLGGGIVACCAWPLGWVRRILVLASAGLPIFLLPIVAGVLNGVALAVGSDMAEAVHTAGTLGRGLPPFVTVCVVVIIWRLLKTLVSEDPEAPAAMEAARAVRMGPASLWVAAVGMFAAAALIALASVVPASPPLCLAYGVPTLLAGTSLVASGVLLVCGLAGIRGVWRWAWLPLLASTGGGAIPAMMVMVLVLARGDEWTTWVDGAPVDEPAAARIRRRASQPLTPVAWWLIGLSILGMAVHAFVYAGLPLGQAWRVLAAPHALFGLAGVGLGLAAWEFLAIGRQPVGGLGRSARVAMVVAALCIALAAVELTILGGWSMGQGATAVTSVHHAPQMNPSSADRKAMGPHGYAQPAVLVNTP
jgi:hypothetical protein